MRNSDITPIPNPVEQAKIGQREELPTTRPELLGCRIGGSVDARVAGQALKQLA